MTWSLSCLILVETLSSPFWILFVWNVFPFVHFQPICVFGSKLSLLGHIELEQCFLIYPTNLCLSLESLYYFYPKELPVRSNFWYFAICFYVFCLFLLIISCIAVFFCIWVFFYSVPFLFPYFLVCIIFDTLWLPWEL